MLAESALNAFEAGIPAYVPPPPGFYPESPPRREVVGLRPVDLGDRARVEEICSGSFSGADQLPLHFDDWVESDEAGFVVAEVDGRVAALHRVVVAGEGVAWYEGLRVAPEFRRQGLGRTMLEMALASARRRGLTEMRLHAGPECGGFFERAGFAPVLEVARWDAEPSRGGHLPAVLDPEHTDVALDWFRQDDAFRRYPGLNPVFGRSAAGDRRNVDRLARDGSLRFCGEVPAFAAVLPGQDDAGPLRVTFLAGQGESMYDLLKGMRHQAHADGRDRVRVMAPADHPCHAELAAAGFAVRDDFRLTLYARSLLRPSTQN
jgi:GNAT superfamily N-acetyltransferase